jgi:hypothetical protein
VQFGLHDPFYYFAMEETIDVGILYRRTLDLTLLSPFPNSLFCLTCRYADFDISFVVL